MTTLNISLPEEMQAFIDQKVAQGGFGDAGEYVRQLVREDQKRAAQERLEELLMEGIESDERIEGTPEYWEQKRTKLLMHNEEKDT